MMWLEAVVELVSIAVVGRLCLSMLPPGWPGYHDVREGGATLGASLLLGSVAGYLLPYWWLWALALVIRWLLLPGAMRPRHELPIPAGRLFDRLVLLVAVAALAWAAWSSPWSPPPTSFEPGVGGEWASSTWVLRSPLVAQSLLIGSALVLHALLLHLRWRPALRTAAITLVAAVVVLALARVPAPALAPGLLGAAWIVAGWWSWRRFADRRARALAALGLASALLLAPWGLL